jgi:hypothetical protein
MAESIMDCIVGYYHRTHALILKVVGRLDDQQMIWQPSLTAPCIAFHLWHVARWADYLQEMITDGGVQIWEREGLAAKWDLSEIDLGFAETGMGLDDDATASLPLPGKDVLLDYARRAFAEADRAAGAIHDDQFHRKVQDLHGAEWKELAIGDAVVGWLAHDGRHLGMIEALLGAQGMHGTATQ